MNEKETNLKQLFLQYGIDVKQFESLADAVIALHDKIKETQKELKQVTSKFKDFSRKVHKNFKKVSPWDIMIKQQSPQLIHPMYDQTVTIRDNDLIDNLLLNKPEHLQTLITGIREDEYCLWDGDDETI